jgi:hypothetical protein
LDSVSSFQQKVFFKDRLPEQSRPFLLVWQDEAAGVGGFGD